VATEAHPATAGVDEAEAAAPRHDLGFDESGSLVHNLQGPTGSVAITTSARWFDGRLYIGALEGPDVVTCDLG